MLSSRSTYRVVAAIVVVVSFTTGSLCEVVWSRGVESEVAPLYDTCTAQLEAATDGELTRLGFVELVESLSHHFVQGPFRKLPLKYKSMFHAHACMNGRYCVGDFASIPVATKEEQMLTCSTLATQISRPMPSMVDRIDTYRNETIASRYNGTFEEPICTTSGIEVGMACVSN